MAKEKDVVSTDDNKQNEGKAQALRTVLASIEKQFGKGTVMKFSDDTALPEVEFISTGSVLLDQATGGGVPRGRIVEIYGPESSGKTSLCLSTIAQAQKMGLQCAFIDVENALDVTYAQKLGVNLNDLLISQPDYGEQALEITDSLISSNAVDLIIVDSVAALVPKAELEGDMGDSHMGLQARLMSQALRKITGSAKRNNTTVIFINQIRMKIGVMFGCVHGETLVNFVDGRSVPMRDVVEKQITGKVWSWNEKTKEYEAKEITDWHHNSYVYKPEDYLHIQTQSIDGMGRFGLTVTPNHKIMTESGWKKAKNISLTDKLQSRYLQQVNGTLADFLWGTFVGDCHIRIRDKSTGSFRFQDGTNPEYVQWKLNKLKNFYSFKESTYGKDPLKSGEKRVKYTTKANAELALIKQELGERDPEIFLNNHYSPMGLALWYMDDGHVDVSQSHKRCTINIKRFSHEHTKLDDIAKSFEKATGILPRVRQQDGSLIFNTENCIKLMNIIAQYIPECMQYKLPAEFQGRYVDFELSNKEKIVPVYVPIIEIRHASKRQMRMKDKYDISVADHHNYMVGGINNGVIVHNSPETTAGGNALKFYASMRLDIRRIGAIKDKEVNIGNHVRIKTVKNKVFPPFKEAEVDFLYEKGFNLVGEILDMAVDKGFVVKGGAWYSYNDAKLGQGRDNSCGFLADNPAIFEEIKAKVLAK